MDGNFKMIAKTFFGFEDVLAEELKNLGAINVTKNNRMVAFEGDLGFLYKANLSLRSALKILKPLATFKITNRQNLYDLVGKIAWEDWFDINQSFSIDSLVFSELFNNSMFVSQVVKDAIVDRFRKKTGLRPSVNSTNPQINIVVHLSHNQCSISLDSSGSSLHHRGYRSVTNIAPINEVLGAGLLLKAGWCGQSDFYDPMCGSGTLLIEAAMIACNIPANIHRRKFGFQNWKDFNEELFQKIKESCLNKTKDFRFKIYGSDKAPSAIRKSQENVSSALLEDFIFIKRGDFFVQDPPANKSMFIVINPPYGERLPIDANLFYEKMGTTLKHSYSGSTVWIISSNSDAMKRIGLKPKQKIKTYNGSLEASWQGFDLFDGKRKNYVIDNNKGSVL